MFDDLLPLTSESPRCNDFARSLGLRPLGSGLFLERVILVSTPLPWPKPALKHPRLEPSAAHVVGSRVPSRLFAAEPFGDSIHIEVYERTDDQISAAMHCWTVEDIGAVEPLIADICEASPGSLPTLTASGAKLTESGPADPTFLICTQGSHDLCCGTSGVSLANELADHRPNYRVRRVSHTGGHRFSPTLMAFPEGRMWAYADLELVDRIAQGAATADDYQMHSRGWWGAKVGPAQVAEGAVRAQLATAPFERPQITADESTNGDRGPASSRFEVTSGDTTFVVDVSVGRQVPSISCEAPGGLPAKPGREFAWTIEKATQNT